MVYPTVSGGATHKPTPHKSIALKTRLTSTPGKISGTSKKPVSTDYT